MSFSTLQELYSDPKRWCSGAAFKDENGRLCRKDSAYSSCIYGGIEIVYGDDPVIRDKIWTTAKRLFGTDVLSKINDSMGYEAVVRLVKEANV